MTSSPPKIDYTIKGDKYIINGEEYPRVTSICNMDGAGKEFLIPWAAKVEREGLLDKFEEIVDSMIDPAEPHRMPSAVEIVEAVQDKLPKKKFHKQISDEALEIGGLMHEAIEWQVRLRMGLETGEYPKLTQPQQRGVDQWIEWADRVKLKPHHVETTVAFKGAEPEFNYAGTFDCIAEVNGVMSVCDWKTGSGIYDSYRAQLAAYRFALEGDDNYPDIEQGVIVLIPKAAKYRFQELIIHDYEEHMSDLGAFRCMRTLYNWHKGLK